MPAFSPTPHPAHQEIFQKAPETQHFPAPLLHHLSQDTLLSCLAYCKGFFFKKKKKNFIYIFIFGYTGAMLLCVGFLQLRGAGFTLTLRGTGSLLTRLLLLQTTGSRAHVLQQLWRKDIVAPQHGGSSRTKDRTGVPCTGTQMLNWTTGEVLQRTLDSLLPPWPVYSQPEARGILPQPESAHVTHPL